MTLDQIKEASAFIMNSWTLGLREAQFFGRKAYFERYKDAYRVHYLYAVIDNAYEQDGEVFIGNAQVGLTYVVDTYHKLWHYRGGWIESGIYGAAETPDYVEGDNAVDTKVPGICVPKPKDGEDGEPGVPGDDGTGVPGTGGTGGTGDDGDNGDVNIDLPPSITPGDGNDGSDGDQTGGTPGGGDGGDSTIIYETLVPEWRIGIIPVTVGENGVTFFKEGVPDPLPDANYVVDMYLIATDGTMQRNLVIGTKAAWGFTVMDVLKAGNLHYQAIPIT